MNISKDWLKEKKACPEGVEWFDAQEETDGAEVVRGLMNNDKLPWANWLIFKLFDQKQRIQYAVFSAEQVIDIFEDKYPNDNRPRETIEAAKRCIEDDTEINRRAALKSADAAARSASAFPGDAADVYAADSAVYAACVAASCAGYASRPASAFPGDAAYTYASCAAAFVFAYDYATAMRKKILEYGISLLKKEDKR